MKKSTIWVAMMLIVSNVCAQVQNPTYVEYINTWKKVAVQQQKDYGVPASITMAQALLESAAGKSDLAVKAKNHFGIKCTSEWSGGVYYYNDNRRGECFRKYKDAAESFKDHSIFLQRPRYATCFEIAVEDYEGWAYRLRQCGYATDPLYASKLIKLIEDYRLDTLAGESKGKRAAVTSAAATAAKRPLKADVAHKTEPIMVVNNDPEPPYVAPLSAKAEKDSFMLMHPKKKCNGVTFVVAREGDTYANVAFRLNMRERVLRVHNDALGRELKVGDRIFLGPKKTSGANEYVWTFPGQTIWALSQEEGVYITAIQKYNGFDNSIRTFRTRQKIYLKKVKE